jgi:OOP family OmpA-OmpF porin
MMNHGKMMGACLLAAMFASAAARAEDDAGFYIGAGIGQASQEAGEFEGDDTSFKVFGGWSFNKYLAVEGGYIDGGSQSDDLGSIHAEVSSDGFFVAALAKLPLADGVVNPYVKLGYTFYDSTTTLSAGSQSISESSGDEDLLFGGGCEFKLGENFRLRAEFEKVNVPDASFEIYSIAGTWQF